MSVNLRVSGYYEIKFIYFDNVFYFYKKITKKDFENNDLKLFFFSCLSNLDFKTARILEFKRIDKNSKIANNLITNFQL